MDRPGRDRQGQAADAEATSGGGLERGRLPGAGHHGRTQEPEPEREGTDRQRRRRQEDADADAGPEARASGRDAALPGRGDAGDARRGGAAHA